MLCGFIGLGIYPNLAPLRPKVINPCAGIRASVVLLAKRPVFGNATIKNSDHPKVSIKAYVKSDG